MTAHKVNYGRHFIANINNDTWNLSNKIILDKYVIGLGFNDVSPDRKHKVNKSEIAEIKQDEYTVVLTINYK